MVDAGDVARPDVVVLVGQAVDEVGDDNAVKCAHLLQVVPGFVAAVFAPHAFADVVVKALDADGDAVDAGVNAGLGFVGVEVADAAFEGDFAVVGERQVALAGADEADEVGGGECGRGAAAEVHGVDFAVAWRCSCS